MTALVAAGAALACLAEASAQAIEANSRPQSHTQPWPAYANVEITDGGFNMAAISVAVGTRIVWSNGGRMAHSVTSDAGAFDSGPIARGGSWGYTFSVSGDFPYHSSPNAAMRGLVRVLNVALGDNVALGKKVYADSYQVIPPGFGAPELAVDGDKATAWASGRYGRPTIRSNQPVVGVYIGHPGHWILVDLGGMHTIDQAKLQWNGNFAARSYALAVQRFGTWRNVGVAYSGNGGEDPWRFAPVLTRYVALLAGSPLRCCAGAQLLLAEFEVLAGAPGAGAPFPLASLLSGTRDSGGER